MANPQIMQCAWPGVVAVESCQYTNGHGITPGKAIFTTFPQTAAPAAFGTLVIGDGIRQLKLPNCRVARMTGRSDSAGQTWVVEIEDRRWSWRGLAGISGTYNRLDLRSKLVPWTIRSPEELAILCLEAMGEVGYEINLPAGLKRADGANLERYLIEGENFQQSLTNPPTTWDHSPPFEVLARLCDFYGCRIVYQPNRDRVLITPTGVGAPLPDAPCEMLTGGVEAPRLPIAVAVAGAPVRIQGRFALEAVGEEWDGRVVPINDLSYAPRVASKVQVTTCTYTGTGNPDLSLNVTLRPESQDQRVIELLKQVAFGTIAVKLASMASDLNNDSEANKVLRATATATTLTLTGLDPAMAFGVAASSFLITPPDKWTAVLTQPAAPGGQRSWRQCPPPLFPTVIATDRLSYGEAQAKARKSVFKWYRIVNLNPYTGAAPLSLPWFGKIDRLQQIILEDSKVAQVEPSQRIAGAQDRNNPIRGFLPAIFQVPGIGGKDVVGNGVLPWFYDGYSRDQPATVTGSVYKGVGGQVMWTPEGDFNTPEGSRVFADFEIDPYWQVVKFGDFVWKHPGVADGSAYVGVPSLILETACRVVDSETGAFRRWEEQLPLGGLAPIEWSLHEDIQVGVIGKYDDSNRPNNLTGFEFFSLQDAKGRAGYYLNGMAARYQLPEADIRAYIGIYPIDPDGLTQQVSYSVGLNGATTVASANSEHVVTIPPYPARRLAENLAPNRQAALANLIERSVAGIPETTG